VKISIALCTYNGEKFLLKQLESILWQTLLPNELVACDDNSTDETRRILDEFRKEAPFPVKICQNDQNLGITRNFEKAIGLCSGDIIVLCDQDDVWKPEKIAIIKDVFRKNPGTGYVFSDANLVGENLQPLGIGLWESVGFQGEFVSRYTAGKQLSCFLRQQFVTGATLAMHTSLKEFIFPFPENQKWIHDGWIALVGSSVGQNGIPVPLQLINYRQHQGQQIGAPDSPPPGTLLAQYQILKQTRKYHVEEWIAFSSFFPFLLDRLYQHRSADNQAIERSIETLEEFLRFFCTRKEIFTAQGFSKFVPVFREFISGRYGKFSYGWKSAFADLILSS